MRVPRPPASREWRAGLIAQLPLAVLTPAFDAIRPHVRPRRSAFNTLVHGLIAYACSGADMFRPSTSSGVARRLVPSARIEICEL